MDRGEQKSYEFTLVLAGPDVVDEANFNVLAEATRDDALFGRRGQLQFADFSRIAPSFPEAVITAVEQVEDALPELRVLRVEPDELVSASEIAKRTRRSRQNINQLVKGERGPKDFPAPAAWVKRRTPLWRWTDVTRWFACRSGDVSREDVFIAEFVAMLNGRLEAREHRRRLEVLATAEPDPDRVTTLLDAIEGAWERAELGHEQAAEGKTVAMDDA